MTDDGMKRDEGEEIFEMIIANAMKSENKEQFDQMFNFFMDYSEIVNYIVVSSRKK